MADHVHCISPPALTRTKDFNHHEDSFIIPGIFEVLKWSICNFQINQGVLEDCLGNAEIHLYA